MRKRQKNVPMQIYILAGNKGKRCINFLIMSKINYRLQSTKKRSAGHWSKILITIIKMRKAPGLLLLEDSPPRGSSPHRLLPPEAPFSTKLLSQEVSPSCHLSFSSCFNSICLPNVPKPWILMCCLWFSTLHVMSYLDWSTSSRRPIWTSSTASTVGAQSKPPPLLSQLCPLNQSHGSALPSAHPLSAQRPPSLTESNLDHNIPFFMVLWWLLKSTQQKSVPLMLLPEPRVANSPPLQCHGLCAQLLHTGFLALDLS